MTRPVADLVKHVWIGTGTGTMILGAAQTGFFAFPPGLDGQVVSYSIEHVNGAERETGIGTYTLSGTTLSRDFVTSSTAGAPNKHSFTGGNKFVRITALGLDVVENRATSDPAPTDDITAGYIAGRSRWLNTSRGALFICVSHAAGSAIWRPMTEAPTSIKTGAYQAVAGDGPVRTSTAGGGFTVTTPVGPRDGQRFTLEDAAEGGSWNIANPLLLVTSAGSTLAGNSGAAGVNHDGGTSAVWRYNAVADDWGYVGEAGGGPTGGLGALTNGGAFVPTAINLSTSAEYIPYPQTGPLNFALASVTEVPGAEAWVQFTGNSSAITWSSDFAAADGASLTGGEYAGFVGTKRLALRWSGTQGKALVLLSGVSQIDETLTGVATTASRTLGLSDAGRRIIEANHATVAIVLTVPPNSTTAFPVSTLINVERTGAAAVSVTGGAGVTVNKPSDRTLAIRAQWEVITLRKTATNTWVAFGALGAA